MGLNDLKDGMWLMGIIKWKKYQALGEYVSRSISGTRVNIDAS